MKPFKKFTLLDESITTIATDHTIPNMEKTKKKPITEMTYDQLLFARHVVDGLKNEAVRNENFAMALEYRTKQVKIEGEILKRFQDQFDI